MHPIIAIVGRANVGKSRLFNRLVGKRRAIVADIPGFTRDRHYSQGEWAGREFIAVDTGGLDLDPDADLERRVTDQSLKAIEEADLILCLFDGGGEPTAIEREVVDNLRKVSKPVLYAVNKIDTAEHEAQMNLYYELGIDQLFPISAEHGRGVDDLLDEAIRLLGPERRPAEVPREGATVAVVGRPNVGKSTLINRLAGEERVVVHEIPGTTRDAIDVEIQYERQKYVFIDTAGVKRRFMVSGRMEKFTALRSLRTIDRAQVVCQLIDGSEGLTRQDLHLTSFVLEQGKGLLLLVNKWDLLDADWPEYERRLRQGLGDMKDVTAIPISAATGMNCLKVFFEIENITNALGQKIATAKLNRVIERALEEHHLPAYRGRAVRIYYASQVGTFPPTFILFTNYPEAVPTSYRRYLTRRLQDELGIKGVPVRIVCRKK